jgi:hypothetical protein
MDLPLPSSAEALPLEAEHLPDGDLMFVGFDSQNTSHFFLHYPNLNLKVWGILLIGFRGRPRDLVCHHLCPER